MSRSTLRVLTIMFSLLFLPQSAWSLSIDSLRVSIAVNKGGQYVKPFDRKITIRRQPMPFYVEIKNTSRSSQKLWDAPMGDPDNVVSIEIIDERRRRTIITKRRDQLPQSRSSFRYLSPGESLIISMLIDPDDWENVPILESGQVKYFKARAIFQNGFKKIYSDYYEVTLGGQGY